MLNDVRASDRASESSVLCRCACYDGSPAGRIIGGIIIALAGCVYVWSARDDGVTYPSNASGGADDVASAISPIRPVHIDINRADEAELSLLPEVGPAMAKAIIAERTAHGPFRSVGELDRVRGVGPATLAAITPWVTVGSTDAGGHGAS